LPGLPLPSPDSFILLDSRLPKVPCRGRSNGLLIEVPYFYCTPSLVPLRPRICGFISIAHLQWFDIFVSLSPAGGPAAACSQHNSLSFSEDVCDECVFSRS
jgi:hypothetical protein